MISKENLLKNFANDAIKNNPNAENLDEKAAENIKNNFATKKDVRYIPIYAIFCLNDNRM